jgi:hypothetical protein
VLINEEYMLDIEDEQPPYVDRRRDREAWRTSMRWSLDSFLNLTDYERDWLMDELEWAYDQQPPKD